MAPHLMITRETQTVLTVSELFTFSSPVVAAPHHGVHPRSPTTRRPALLSMVINALPGSWEGAPRAATLRVEADFVTCTQ